MIKIIDCGSQLTQNIARRVRERKVYSEIIPFHKADEISKEGLEGIIISGGQFSVYDNGAPKVPKRVLELGVPILGICYGHQLLAEMLGGKAVKTDDREYGETSIALQGKSELFRDTDRTLKVWMSHGDIVERVPPGFRATAYSQNGHIAAMEGGNVFSVQFHPEVDHTQQGIMILDNFLRVCHAQRTWDPEKDYDRIVAETKEKVADKVGVGGISGGVDSSTMSVLMNQIIGTSYHPIFVDNGVLRLNEAAEVRASLEPFGLNILYVDAAARFLKKLEGIVDPDEKRKIIGHEFAEVFKEAAWRIPGASYLAQGTLYPDVVESVPPWGAQTSNVKRHHNVGGLPKDLGLEVIEPFNRLFKDEVRKIAEHKLGMPREIVWRHPFPGPGLAIRIVEQDVTLDKLRVLREADVIFIKELRERGLYDEIAQAFAVLLGRAVGVMGDERTYHYMIGLRAVTTNDFMTSDVYRFREEDLQAISNRIINQVRGVNRVWYDRSQKPPSTIEVE